MIMWGVSVGGQTMSNDIQEDLPLMGQDEQASLNAIQQGLKTVNNGKASIFNRGKALFSLVSMLWTSTGNPIKAAVMSAIDHLSWWQKAFVGLAALAQLAAAFATDGLAIALELGQVLISASQFIYALSQDASICHW